MSDRASAQALDFSNVKERSAISPKHYPEGDYAGKVLSVSDITMGDQKRSAWLFIIRVKDGTYALRCGFNENELWKIRNLFVACGIAVPKKKLKVDPTKVVGKGLAVTLEDHEYDGKMSSQIGTTFPLADLDGADDEQVDDEDEEAEDEAPAEEEAEDEDEDEEPTPPPTRKKKAAAPAPVDDDEDEDDDLEALDIEDL